MLAGLTKKSALDNIHRSAGARMVAFGGWEMPLSYPPGTIAEHLACRRDAAVFDVSHLGTVALRGPAARERIQSTLTNDLGRIGPGRAQYTHLLDEADGSVQDDIIVWWVGEDAFEVMPNASNTERVLAALGGEDVTESRAILAVQGPHARVRLAELWPEAAAVGRFRVERLEWRGHACVVAGTGYTGEDGVEIRVPVSAAPALWAALLDAGVTPAGLGARDTLRLEAGLPLHGHELGPGITPLDASLSWVVSWTKPEGFPGKAALERQRHDGLRRHLLPFLSGGRQPLREGYEVIVDDEVVGHLTSGNYSPILERGIGLGFVPLDLVPPTAVQVGARGRRIDATLTKTPFVGSGAA
ncbi:MAG: glycine cleavage system aminomethyltransferase GcvT [Acidimicrobiales bacterium]